MEEDQDQKQFFKDLSATVEQTVEEVRGVEENVLSLVQRTTLGVPWVWELNKKLQSYVEQYFHAALGFARELSQAKDLQDFARIQNEFVQTQVHSFGEQTKDFVETYAKVAADPFKTPFDMSSDRQHSEVDRHSLLYR
jgi:hypothetical protein